MPIMDGLEATRRIRCLESSKKDRADSNDKSLVIIGLSADSDHSAEDNAHLTGFDAFMEKPFHLDAFEAVAHQLLVHRTVLPADRAYREPALLTV